MTATTSRRRAHIAGTGLYRASEFHYLTRPADVPLAECRLVVFDHGSGQSPLAVSGSAGQTNHRIIARAPVAAGCAVAAFDFGGASTWANSTNEAALDDAFTFLADRGANTDTVALWGESMGHVCAFHWAHDHPDQVAAVWGTISVCDATAYHASAPTNINAAWGGDWAANGGSATDPTLLAPTCPAVPWRGYYATDDATLLNSPATNAALAAILDDGGAISMGAGGHTGAPLAAIDGPALLAWLDAADWG